jgi:hypothetical protein
MVCPAEVSPFRNVVYASGSARPRERPLKAERGAGSAVAAECSGAALDFTMEAPGYTREANDGLLTS